MWDQEELVILKDSYVIFALMHVLKRCSSKAYNRTRTTSTTGLKLN